MKIKVTIKYKLMKRNQQSKLTIQISLHVEQGEY